MDETWITLDDCNSEGEYFYTDGFMEVPDDWRKKPVKQWPKKIMVAIGICWNGMSKPYVVDGNYLIDNFLSSMVHKDIPRLYPKNPQDIWVHFDRAKSHVAMLTQNWMEEHHPNYIPEDHWMANSPNLAPLDYAINGILKKNSGERKVTTIAGLSKVLHEVCANFDLGVIRRSLLSWESRVQKMLDKKGDYIELD
ncbi:hypothetical protein RvY_15307 [Ramazzottius varieornatus]|uniref:Tc1-like transposase DDE domain-containing protein n=1 Tax=Ramazzottius varieornatus TaxID=947166 RepID=A0A1D1VVR7_RAMVA|nr:hypothetical protein RvY_15307 [Ramazzottius varieornatus]